MSKTFALLIHCKMARKKRKTSQPSLQKCNFCLKRFFNLGLHFYNSPLCADFNINNDLTLVATNNQIQSLNDISSDTINNNTIDYHHTNDVNDNLFEINDNESIHSTKQVGKSNTSTTSNQSSINTKQNIPTTLELNQTTSTQHQPPQQILVLQTEKQMTLSPSLSQQSLDDESLNSNVVIQCTNSEDNEYLETCTQIDTMLDQMKTTLSISTIANINRAMITTIKYQPCLYNFTQFRISVLKQMVHLPIDHGMIASIKLLKLMKDGNIANSQYKKLIEWHLDTMNTTTQSHSQTTYPIIKSRKIVIDNLHKLLFQMSSDEYSMRPIHSLIMLPSMRTSKISKFDLKSSLVSLLTDPYLMQRDTTYLNDNTYTNPKENTSSVYQDIHHGSSFVNAYEKMCKEPNDILVPIIPFIDGTPIDPYGRNKLEVVMFTLGLFKQKIRHKTTAWRIAGYIPDPCNENSGQHDFYELSSKKQKIAKRKDYHEMLKYILHEFIELEKSDGIVMELPNYNGTKLIQYRFKFVILFIIGDAVGHDKLCDRYASYGKNVKRLCRDCNCPSDELNNHKYHCTFTKRSTLLQMDAKELSQISYYKIDNNALDNLSFGGNVYGMNGSLPPEPLHQLNQGVFKKLLDYFDDCITSKGESMLDKIVKYLSMNSHRQSDRQYSRIDLFKDGLEKCQLSGTEIIHKVFMLYITLIQTYVIKCLPEVEQTCQQRYKKKNKQEKHESNPNDNDPESYFQMVSITKYYYAKIGNSKQHLIQWIHLLEATLGLDEWINQDEFLVSDLKCHGINDSVADIAIRNYLNQYTNLIHDPIGNGTQTSKIHWLLHIPHYIRKFGPAKAYNGQTPEHCLSPLVKDAARRTQLRPSALVEQSCERYYENLIIQRSNDILQQQNVIKKDQEQSQYITNMQIEMKSTSRRTYYSHGQYDIIINKEKKYDKIIWNCDTTRTKHVMQNESLIQAVINRLHLDDFQLQSSSIACVTTLHIMDPSNSEKMSFRADPYFYKRPWHDWCVSNWELSDSNISNDDNENESNHYPSRIMMIIDTKNMQFNKNLKKFGQYLAVVKATEKDTRTKRERPNEVCTLIKTYDTDKYIRIIGCNSIIKTCFVIPDIENVISNDNKNTFVSNHVMMFKDKKQWSNMFLKSEWI